MGTETRAQALWGAAGAKPLQLASLKMVQNKGWASLVSAAAVIPAPRVVGTIIGPKASVAGLASLPLNPAA
jgi:hypothetical protein